MASRWSELARAGLGYQVLGRWACVGAWPGRVGVSMVGEGDMGREGGGWGGRRLEKRERCRSERGRGESDMAITFQMLREVLTRR